VATEHSPDQSGRAPDWKGLENHEARLICEGSKSVLCETKVVVRFVMESIILCFAQDEMPTSPKNSVALSHEEIGSRNIAEHLCTQYGIERF
jgi:hypothetical protein